MSCCGKKRESLARTPVKVQEGKMPQPAAVVELPKPVARGIFFCSTGTADINVRGPASGRTYYFPANKGPVEVDERDAPYLSSISRLQKGVQPGADLRRVIRQPTEM
jgi:hypothetical protein